MQFQVQKFREISRSLTKNVKQTNLELNIVYDREQEIKR